MGTFYKEFNLKKVLECGAFKKVIEANIIKKLDDLNSNTNLVLTTKILDGLEYRDFSDQIGVAINNKSKKPIIVGIISKDEDKLLKNFLDMGWEDAFSAIISQNDANKPLDNRFKVAVFIEKKQ